MLSFHGTKAAAIPLMVSGGLRGEGIRWRPARVCTACRCRSFQIRASYKFDVPVMSLKSCCGKMGKAVIEAADSAGLDFLPVSFGNSEEAGQTVEIRGKGIQVHGPLDRESILVSVFREHPNMIVVDYTVPDAVNNFGFDKHIYNVLEVNETSYEDCIDEGFITNVTRGGRDVFNLTDAKTYYFICGRGYCFQGMKVAVHVVEEPPSPPPAPLVPAKSSGYPAAGSGLVRKLLVLVFAVASAVWF